MIGRSCAGPFSIQVIPPRGSPRHGQGLGTGDPSASLWGMTVALVDIASVAPPEPGMLWTCTACRPFETVAFRPIARPGKPNAPHVASRWSGRGCRWLDGPLGWLKTRLPETPEGLSFWSGGDRPQRFPSFHGPFSMAGLFEVDYTRPSTQTKPLSS